MSLVGFVVGHQAGKMWSLWLAVKFLLVIFALAVVVCESVLRYEDAWVADRPGAQLAARGVDVILNPSASHFALQG